MQSQPVLNILLTGGNTGIGFETAKKLCLSGHSVTITCRDAEKGKTAVQNIKNYKMNAKISYIVIELSRLETIERAVDMLKQNKQAFDVVVLNAGVMLPQQIPEATMETTLLVNYLAHYYLSKLLINVRPKGQSIHFVCLSSVLAIHYSYGRNQIPSTAEGMRSVFCKREKRGGFRQYTQSKYAMVLLAQYLNKLDMVTAVAVNPGNSVTTVTRNMKPTLKRYLSIFKRSLIPAEKAADNVIRAVMEPLDSGKVHDQGRVQPLAKKFLRAEVVDALEKVSEELLDVERNNIAQRKRW